MLKINRLALRRVLRAYLALGHFFEDNVSFALVFLELWSRSDTESLALARVEPVESLLEISAIAVVPNSHVVLLLIDA